MILRVRSVTLILFVYNVSTLRVVTVTASHYSAKYPDRSKALSAVWSPFRFAGTGIELPTARKGNRFFLDPTLA